MVKKVRRSNVKDGVLLPLGNGFSLVKGDHPNKTDDVDIGPNNKNGLSVNHGEILQQKGNTLRVFSAEPMLGGVSPVQLLYGGMAPDKVFTIQEQYKQANRIADDGTKYQKGGKKETPLKEIDWSGITTTNNRPYNAEYIDYINKSLINSGYNVNQRASILANIIEESGGNPFAEGPGGYYGLLQWGSERYSKGKETDAYKEIDNQLKYLNNTISNTNDKKSWTHGGKGSGYNSFTDAMNAYNSDELNKVMHGFTWGYVRPAGKQNSYLNRQKVADQLINLEGFKFGGRKQFQAGGEDKSNSFKTVKQRTDFKQTGIKKFIVDKFGEWYYPNPVGVHGDFSRFYFGRPTKNNTFYVSRYKPSKSKNKDTIYYGVKSPAFLNDLIHLYNNRANIDLLKSEGNQVIDGYKARTSSELDDRYIGNNIERYYPSGDLRKKGLLPPQIGSKNYMLSDSVGALGNFTIGRGKDENGEYLSYYDLWDVSNNPAEKYNLAKPYEIYDRIYGVFDKNGVFTPNGTIEPSIITADKKQFGGQTNINSLGERPNAKFGKEMKNKRIKSLTGTQLDAIGAGINTLGSLIGAGIQQGAINGLTFTPRQYSLLNPVKLKTKINIKPQVSKLKEIQAQLADAARRTSSSSRTAYQKILAGHNRILDSAMDLYGRQENMETELINQDRLNQQQIAATNSKNVMDIVNYNIEGKDNLNNQKRIYTSNNWTTALNTTAGAWAGPNGFIDRSNARRVKAGELYVQAIANPDAARLLYGDINFVTDADKRKAFKTIYNFLNNNNLG